MTAAKGGAEGGRESAGEAGEGGAPSVPAPRRVFVAYDHLELSGADLERMPRLLPALQTLFAEELEGADA
jgi:hypothetical protein